MSENPYQAPREVGFHEPQDSNERVRRYLVYMSIALASLIVIALIGVIVRLI